VTKHGNFGMPLIMSSVTDIEKAVKKLSEPELDAFRRWFEEFDAARFDAKIERDAASGNLEALAKAAIDDVNTGRVRSL
jgi:hypothetical protein